MFSDMDSLVDVKVIRMAEVEEHNREAATNWTVIYGKVYDMTKFLEEHPGGGEILLENAGLDSSEQFDDVGHSSDAKEMLDEFFLGILHPDDVENTEPEAAPFTLPWIPLAFGLLLTVLVTRYAFTRR